MRWIVAVVTLVVLGVAVLAVTHMPRPLHLLFVGDVMLSRSVGDMMVRRNDFDWPFERIASATSAADLTFGNLETPVSMRGAATGCGYCFRADPRVTAGLRYAGFDVMSVANNHSHDYGPLAFTDTVSALASAGIAAVGADGPVIRTVRGVRIGFLAYSYPLSEPRITADIRNARPLSDVLIVSFHAGTEYETVHNALQQEVYRAAIDAGADLVVGTHPHVVQDIEKYHGRWIAYSLGNFIFDQSFEPDTMRGLILDVAVNGTSIAAIATRSVDISHDYQASLRR